jgi:PAS domain S-box-containing protein
MDAPFRQNQEFTLLAMQASRMYAFEWNPRTDEITRSHNCAELLGIAGDVTSEKWTECMQRVHPADRDHLLSAIGRLTPVHDSCECDYRVTGIDGKVRYLHTVIRGFFDRNCEPERYVGIVDAGRAKQAELAIYEGEERFRKMADTAPMMICASGPDQLATYFNKAWLMFTGRQLEAELGFGWTEGLHKDDLDRTLTLYKASFAARCKCNLEYRLRRSDGEYRWLACSGVPCWTADGTFTGYIGSCIDITDIKRAQEEAFDKQKLESLRMLTGGIAHDFNNLLGGILAEAELFESGSMDRLTSLDSIRRIQRVAARAAEIVRELMIYSGQDKATLEPVNISQIVGEMLELLKVSISKHATLLTSLADDLPVVLANTTQIRQVVMNLIINASEAIVGQDGTIRIATSKLAVTEGANGAAAVLQPGSYVRLEITDTGCGMADEQRSRIFDPFFTTKSGGHGLGLAVVEGIVRSHGGMVNVMSAPGQGTTFEVFLPCARDIVGRRSPSPAREAPQRHTKNLGTVLLVEKEDSLRISVGKALLRRGFSILGVPDGPAALEVVRDRANDIDAVVMEIPNGDCSGLEALKQIRLIGRAVPFIFTTADGLNSWKGGTGEKGFRISVLKKPYRITELVDHLKGTMSIRCDWTPKGSAAGGHRTHGSSNP